MALSTGANITGLSHTLQQFITQLALYKLEIPGKYPKHGEILIVNADYWYRTTRKHSVLCTGIVAL